MPSQRAPGDGLAIRVAAEELWWRVECWPPGADAPILSANEIRFPAGSRTELQLTARKRKAYADWRSALTVPLAQEVEGRWLLAQSHAPLLERNPAD